MTDEQTAADGGTDRAWAEAFLAEWRRPYFGADSRDAVAAVVRAARAAALPTAAPAQGDRLTDAEQESIAEWVYEAYRLGRSGTQDHLPMWHEPESRYRVPGLEIRRTLEAVERILAARQRPEAEWDEAQAVTEAWLIREREVRAEALREVRDAVMGPSEDLRHAGTCLSIANDLDDRIARLAEPTPDGGR